MPSNPRSSVAYATPPKTWFRWLTAAIGGVVLSVALLVVLALECDLYLSLAGGRSIGFNGAALCKLINYIDVEIVACISG